MTSGSQIDRSHAAAATLELLLDTKIAFDRLPNRKTASLRVMVFAEISPGSRSVQHQLRTRKNGLGKA